MELSPPTLTIDADQREAFFEVTGKLGDPSSANMGLGGVPPEYENLGVVFELERQGGARWKLKWDREIPETMRVYLDIRADRGGRASMRLLRDDAPVFRDPDDQVTAQTPGGPQVYPAGVTQSPQQKEADWIAQRLLSLIKAGTDTPTAATQAKEEWDAAQIKKEAEVDKAQLAARIAELIVAGDSPAEATRKAMATELEKAE